MDITETLAALTEVVSAAKPRALGGGAIIDRDRALQLAQQAQQLVPEEVHRAHGVLAERDALIAAAAEDAEAIRQQGRDEAARMVSEHEVTLAAQDEAARILAEAHAEAQRKRAETDAYVDAKLAAFEGTLQRTLESVVNGRQKLAGQWQEQPVEPAAGQ